VPPSATLDDLRRSFRQRAKEVHPDLHPDKADWAHAQFQRLNDAYDILSDTALRAEYDEKRRRYRRERGPDGVAWWDRPHPHGTQPESPPPTEPQARPASPPPAMPPRRRPTAPYNPRRDRFRFYQMLFLVSSVVFCGSFLAFITPRSAELPATVPEATRIEPSLTPTPALLPCDSPDVLITNPVDGAEMTRDFTIRGWAYDWHFRYYTLEITALSWEAEPSFSTITPEIAYQGWKPVWGDVLFPDFPAQRLSPGDHVARLTVYLDNGAVLPPCEVRFSVAADVARRR
jgi:hypothetical protein